MDAQAGVHVPPLRWRVGTQSAATHLLADRELPSSLREDLGVTSGLDETDHAGSGRRTAGLSPENPRRAAGLGTAADGLAGLSQPGRSFQ